MPKNLTLIVVSSLIVACGSDSPVDKCDDLVETVCDRAVECIPTGGTHSECVEQVQTALPCGSAVRVTASYNRCIGQLDTVSCAVLFPNGQLDLPADCEGVILTSRLVPDDSGASYSEMTQRSFALSELE